MKLQGIKINFTFSKNELSYITGADPKMLGVRNVHYNSRALGLEGIYKYEAIKMTK